MRHPTRWMLLLWASLLAPWLAGFGWTWDDRPLLLHAALEPAGQALRTAWTSDFWALAPPEDRFPSGMYRPLVTTTYVLGHAIGLGPGGQHLVNLLLHLWVAWATARLARRLGGTPWLAGGLVLLHPHAAELVGSVTARTDLLAAAGLLASLLARRTWVAALALAAGALSKEVALVGIALHPLVDLLEGRWRPTRWLALAAAALAVLAAHLVLVPIPPGQIGRGGALGALASTGEAIFDLLVPLDAGPWPAPRPPALGLATLAVALAGLAALRVTGRREAAREVAFGLGWIAAAWAPMAGWLPLDVRPSRALLYLPLLGTALVLARLHARSAVRPALPAAALGVLAAVHLLRLAPWHDPLDLWTWATDRNPTLPLAWVNLGRARVETGDRDGAAAAWHEAARLALEQRDATFFVRATESLGRLALEAGRVEEAITYLEDAVRVGGPEHAPYAAARLRELGRLAP